MTQKEQDTKINLSNKYDFLFKIPVIGDCGVGKSNLVTRFTKNEFSLDSKSTIGADFHVRSIIIEEKIIKAQIWDTSGQERYRSITAPFYRGSPGAVIVFDITKISTYQSVGYWLKELRSYANAEVTIVLVGNKTDLEHLRAVPTEEAKAFAAANDVAYIETSALDATNVDQAFEILLRDIYKNTSSNKLEGKETEAMPVGQKVVIDQPTENKQTTCQC